jgi:hypothetical protein
VLDVAAVVGARLAPRAPVGLWAIDANALLLVTAVALLVAVMRLACGTWLIAAAAGLAVAVLPAFDPRLSPFDGAAIVVAAGTLIAMLGVARSGDLSRHQWPWRVCLGLLLTALIAPRAAIVLAGLAGGYAWAAAAFEGGRHRKAAAGTAAAAVLGGVLVLLALTPGLPPLAGPAPGESCLLPTLTRMTGSIDGLQTVITSAGPFGVGLAALGAFSIGMSLKRRCWPLVAYAVLPLVDAAAPPDGLIRGFAPTIVCFWILVAIGLTDAARACRPGVAGRIAAGILLLLLPILQLPALRSRAQPAATSGQERLSLQAFHRLLAAVPDNSVLVVEDAWTTTLLRALDGAWQKMGKTLRLVEGNLGALSAVVDDPRFHVLALPRGQSHLQFLGFALTDLDLGGLSGLAEVTRGGSCHVVDQDWVDLPGLAQGSTLSIVARHPGEAADGVLYVASRVAPVPTGFAWFLGDGFQHRAYLLATEADRSQFEADAREDGLPADAIVRRAPLVTRLQFWRSPTAAGVLAVALGVRPSRVVGRASAYATHGVLVCPVFPHAPRVLGGSQ